MNYETHKVLSDEQVEEENIKLACAYHAAALIKNFRKRLKLDDYGSTISDDRPVEAMNFLTNKGLSIRAIGEITAIKLVLSEVEKLTIKSSYEELSSAAEASSILAGPITLQEEIARYAPKIKRSIRSKMSDSDRKKLLEKRAELKKRIGPNREERIRAEQIKIIRAACEEHFAILTRKLRASQVYNDYKILVADGAPLECKRFLFDLRLNYDRLSDEQAVEIILNTVAEIKSSQSKGGQDLSEYPQDGIDFEHWCADVLISSGWEATVSQASGDQGVDILATRGSIILAVQCKRYGSPVGNKAVQEAFAGKQHVNATHACVIATSGFTKSAKELATSTSVLLVAPEDIPLLDQLL
ncbi:restriction endonuclease [Pseudopelagicola sp. nBUS_20]|uniref:restriction endonuclease n=1 Tax=Pseudopelagicola sp. nBUS_20 TaxID=3395317 RepID=UPI003EB949C2